MSYKITKKAKAGDREVLSIRTRANELPANGVQWWRGKDERERANGVISTASYLKQNSQFIYRQAATYSRLYSNQPMYGVMGGSLGRMSSVNQLPLDRPTMNVVQSCVDTLVSRLSQSRPRPVFLTDNGDYRERNIAKQLNQFIAGELYRSKGYSLGPTILKDACVLGTGAIKVYEGQDKLVKLERVLVTELLVDTNDGLYGDPRQVYQLKLVDREVLAAMFPDKLKEVSAAEMAYPDNSADTSKSIADQVMVVESWHLPSAPNLSPEDSDGRHIIAVAGASQPLCDEPYCHEYFPFVFLRYNERLLGFWGQSLAEQLMGTQMEINKLMMTIAASINMVGVPRVFVENGSKVVKAHLNNQVGAIITYSGTKPDV